MKIDNVPGDVLDLVESELLEEEELLWIGQPAPRATLRAGRGRELTVVLVLGGVMAMMAFMLPMIMAEAPDFPAFIMFIPFLIVLSVVFLPLLYRLFMGGRTTYAITDRRVLIMQNRTVTSYGPDDLHFIERRMHGQDRGDLIFARQMSATSSSSRSTWSEDIGFFGIDKVRAVEALMLKTFRGEGEEAAKRKRRLADSGYDSGEVAYYEDSDAQQAQS